MTELTHPLATVPRDELVARAEADPLRPRFHFVSPAGWLNDPNGVSQWNGTYHLFYQYNPEGAFHHHIQWGHATSTDLVTWSDQPVALEPSQGPDAEGCWSGVLVNDDGTPTLVYSGRAGERELACVAVGSADLSSWTKAPENPVIAAPPAGVDITAYRDHCVWREGHKMAATGGLGHPRPRRHGVPLRIRRPARVGLRRAAVHWRCLAGRSRRHRSGPAPCGNAWTCSGPAGAVGHGPSCR